MKAAHISDSIRRYHSNCSLSFKCFEWSYILISLLIFCGRWVYSMWFLKGGNVILWSAPHRPLFISELEFLQSHWFLRVIFSVFILVQNSETLVLWIFRNTCSAIFDITSDWGIQLASGVLSVTFSSWKVPMQVWQWVHLIETLRINVSTISAKQDTVPVVWQLENGRRGVGPTALPSCGWSSGALERPSFVLYWLA
jgi:hypothetical protein